MANHKIVLTEKRIESFWKKVKIVPDGCWEWQACKTKAGYGRFGVAGSKSTGAHRVSWVIMNGEIEDDVFVCHRCDNPSCVRPNHLFVGSRQDNINDMMIKKRSKHFNKNVYYGVRWENRVINGRTLKGSWRSWICVNGREKKLGHHASVKDAARNYDRIAYIVYGERKLLNFPEEYNLD